MSSRPADHHARMSLAELVDLQAGAIDRSQARKHGFSDAAAQRRIRTGRWQRLHSGVYATHSGRPTLDTLWWAALLRCGEGSVLSHLTAGYLHGLVPSPPARIDVTIPFHRRVRPTPGVTVHRSRRLPEVRDPGVLPPRTRIDDTVLDLVGSADRLADALAVVAKGCQLRMDPAGLRAALEARPTLRWKASLLPILDDIATGSHSLLELLYLRRVERAHRLPRARRQRPVSRGAGGTWTDCHYEEFGTSVELDGRLGHAEPGERWRDMDRDNRNTVAGETTLRYGWADVAGRPCVVARQVSAVLTRRGWIGQPGKCGPSCGVLAAQCSTLPAAVERWAAERGQAQSWLSRASSASSRVPS